MSDTDTANEEQPLQVQDEESESKTDIVNQPRSSVKFDGKETIYINNIKVACEEFDGLDIFQLMAINTDKGLKTRAMQTFNALKCFLCAGKSIYYIFNSSVSIPLYVKSSYTKIISNIHK